jgi:hypothetical protein
MMHTLKDTMMMMSFMSIKKKYVVKEINLLFSNVCIVSP